MDPGPKIQNDEHIAELPLTFHPSSKVAAVLDSSFWIVSIVDVESGKVLATLDAPEQSQVHYLVFSPDGHVSPRPVGPAGGPVGFVVHPQRLKALGLADGFPDIFGGAGTVADAPPVDRIEVQGADPAGLKVLAARHTVARGWFNFRSLLEPDLADPEELLQRGNRWNGLGHDRLAAADFPHPFSLRPDSADTANELAWCLVSVPGRGDPVEALASARRP